MHSSAEMTSTPPTSVFHFPNSSPPNLRSPPSRRPMSATASFFAPFSPALPTTHAITPASPMAISRPGSPPMPGSARRPLFARKTSATQASFPGLASPGLGVAMSGPTGGDSGFGSFTGSASGSPRNEYGFGGRRRRTSNDSISSFCEGKGKDRDGWDGLDNTIVEEDENAPSRPASKEDLRASVSALPSFPSAISSANPTMTSPSRNFWATTTSFDSSDRPWRPLSARPATLALQGRPKSFPSDRDAETKVGEVEDRLDRLLRGFGGGGQATPALTQSAEPEEEDVDEDDQEELPILPIRFTPCHRQQREQRRSAFRTAADALTTPPRALAPLRSCRCTTCAPAGSCSSSPEHRVSTRHRSDSTSSSSSTSSQRSSNSGFNGDGDGEEEAVLTAQTSPALSLTEDGVVKGLLLVSEGAGVCVEAVGKGKVRFCEAEGEEILTWSPLVYNRRGPLPVAKLTMRDVLELRDTKIELGIAVPGSPGLGMGLGLGNSNNNSKSNSTSNLTSKLSGMESGMKVMTE